MGASGFFLSTKKTVHLLIWTKVLKFILKHKIIFVNLETVFEMFY